MFCYMIVLNEIILSVSVDISPSPWKFSTSQRKSCQAKQTSKIYLLGNFNINFFDHEKFFNQTHIIGKNVKI